MTRRSRSNATKTPAPKPDPQLGLSLRISGGRVYALLRERERLMFEVQQKKSMLDRAIEEMTASARDMLEKLAPLMTRFQDLNTEVNDLFDELLAPGKLSASARKKVKKIRRVLENEGMLEPRDDKPRDDTEFSEGDEDEQVGSPFGGPFQQPEVSSAAPRGQEAGHESLRALFKRLALALHPDRAGHEQDRDIRTEVMKQVTQAYNEGDLARLLELEKLWDQNGTVTSTADEVSRCAELERIIAELRRQSSELTQELRQVQKSARSNNMMGASIDVMLREARAELDAFQTVRDFVKSFRDGKITLAAFVQGPALPVDEAMELQEMLEELARAHAAERRSRARKSPFGGRSQAAPANAQRGKGGGTRRA